MSGINEIVKKYITGDLRGLVPFLEQQLVLCLEKGNDIEAARILAQYGLVELFLANHYATTVIYKQILDEYERDQPDPRKAAAYSRLLGLYQAFKGDKESAGAYYGQSFLQYEQLDWHADEAIMIIEAIYFYCLPYQDRNLLFQGIDRLQKLLQSQGHHNFAWVKRELVLLDSGLHFLQQPSERQKFIKQLKNVKQETYWFGSFNFWAICTNVLALLSPSEQPVQVEPIAERSNLALHQFSISLGEIYQYHRTHQHAKLDDLADRLKAKAAAFKHPWFCFAGDLVSRICKREEQEGHELFSKMEESPNYQMFSRNAVISLWKQHVPNRTCSETAPAAFLQGFKIKLFQHPIISYEEKQLDLLDWKSPHLREFFLYLVMNPQGRISREVVIEELFPDDDIKKSMNRLYVNIHRVNRFLNDYFGIKDPFIQTQQGFVYYNQDLLDEIDIHVYRKLASVANQLWHDDQEAAIELMQKANSIYHNDLLIDFLYLDWLEKYRISLQQTHGKLLRRLAAYYLSTGKKQAYEETYQQLIYLFSFDESLYQDYISYLLKENRQLEAYYWYGQLKMKLEKEFGLAPSFEFASN